ncbi:MAG: hypothetical protein KGH61_00955 [Candidatus Micrarchaeota archaeon]|nr:hypothetical protein [Candidatus Micrarchaeota archaeon]MDE1847503.1 hypothetical protein [Candidatus Micrarchaeota archaeon]MDE1863861.1 hypothetical protein [Candidatus Micrarchaeota archaeon]
MPQLQTERQKSILESHIDRIIHAPNNAAKISGILTGKHLEYSLSKFMLKQIRRGIEKDLSGSIKVLKKEKISTISGAAADVILYPALLTPMLVPLTAVGIMAAITHRYEEATLVGVFAVGGGSVISGCMFDSYKGSLVGMSEINEAKDRIHELNKQIAYIKYNWASDADLQAIYKGVKKKEYQLTESIIQITRQKFDQAAETRIKPS